MGNVLGYNQNWQYRHTGGELLLMGTTGEPSGYYPMDSNELPVQNQPPVACVCYLASGLEVCAPLVLDCVSVLALVPWQGSVFLSFWQFLLVVRGLALE